jgi:subtilase family protein
MIRRFALAVCVLLLVLSVPLSPAAQSSTQAAAVPGELTIRFEGGLASANFAEVIATLGARERLPLVAYVDREGATPAEILAKTGRLVGTTVPPVLDAYLCSMNSHVCELPTLGQRGKWKNIKAPKDAPPLESTCFDPDVPRYVICLPDIKVHPYVTTAVFSYNASREELGHLVVDRSGGCTKFDKRCERLIKDLNRMPVLSNKFPGKLRLPVQGYRVTLPVADARQLEHITTPLNQVIAERRAAGGLATEQMNIYYTVTSPGLKTQWHLPKLADIETDPLGTYVKTLQVMSYPYRTAREFYKEKLARVVVGIWDRHVDTDHCDYMAIANDKAIALPEPLELNPAKDPPIPRKETDCEKLRDPLEERWDHGTAVAGIVGARFNGHGIVGVNPSAFLWAYELDDQGARLQVDDDPIFRIVSSSPIKAPTVINVSLAEPMEQYQSPLEPFIKKNLDVLWVAAAGNQGTQASDTNDCRIIPACLSTFRSGSGPSSGDSVISVVALTADGTSRWVGDRKASNWGTAFDVAAVGVTVSTLHGNSFGSFVGTSAAAPYVTGLASLIVARSRATLKPKDVKDRILYTADFGEAFDDLVRFGRINFARALRFEDRQEFKKDFCPSSGCETARSVKRGLDPVTLEEGLLDGKEIKNLDIPMRDIRRIAAKDDSDRFWIVYVDGGALRKVSDAKFKGSPVLKFKDGAAPPAVPLAILKEYTCALACN